MHIIICDLQGIRAKLRLPVTSRCSTQLLDRLTTPRCSVSVYSALWHLVFAKYVGFDMQTPVGAIHRSSSECDRYLKAKSTWPDRCQKRNSNPRVPALSYFKGVYFVLILSWSGQLLCVFCKFSSPRSADSAHGLGPTGSTSFIQLKAIKKPGTHYTEEGILISCVFLHVSRCPHLRRGCYFESFANTAPVYQICLKLKSLPTTVL